MGFRNYFQRSLQSTVYFGSNVNRTTVPIVTNGLVLYLDAGDTLSYPSSGEVWYDLSGGENNGTLFNGVQYDAFGRGSMSFDGEDDEVKIDIPNFFTAYTQQITMETWVYIPSTATWSNGNRGGIFTRGQFDGSHGLWRTATNNQISFYCRTIGSTTSVESVSTIARNSWYQLVGIWTGTGTQLYVNGSLVDSDSGTLGNTENSGDFGIFEMGRVTAALSANGNRFLGYQTAAKIYNRALTSAEVAQNFNAHRNRFGL